MDIIDSNVLIIGGGVIGLSIAASLSESGYETILVEKNIHLAEEVSARNSGVIHAGFYYPKNSLKSKFCNSGNKLIYDYCSKKNIYNKKTGKILVSNQKKSINIFKEYINNANYIHAEPLRIIDKAEIEKLEPDVEADYGLYSPETGILDVHSYSNSLENDIVSNNGLISLNSYLKNTKKIGDNFHSTIKTGTEECFEIKSKLIIFCAGLHSTKLKNIDIFQDKNIIKDINYTKGHYFKLSGQSPFNHLVYPLPTKYGLGIHACFDIDGSVRFGPDTYITSKIDYTFEPGIKQNFVRAIKEYWPGLNEEKLHEDYVGIRPKIQKSNENFADFSILGPNDHQIDNCIILQGIESPGLTCSLSIADYVTRMIKT